MAQALEVKRVEYKYLLSAEAATALARTLARTLSPDTHNGLGGYRVKSLYFDTADNHDYLLKDAGVFHRKKIRLRLYNEAANHVLLERKEKRGNHQIKVSLPLAPGAAAAYAAGNADAILRCPHPLAGDIYADALRRRPVVMVEYRRTAYTWPVRNTRITLDRDIRYSKTCHDIFAPNIAYYPVYAGNNVVLEVKYNGVLEPFISEALAPYCGARLSYGKYERSRSLL